MRRFVLRRTNPDAIQHGVKVGSDEPTLEGVQFSDGTVVVRWLTAFRSTVVWPDLQTFLAVHVDPHPDYGSVLEWVDDAAVDSSAFACDACGHPWLFHGPPEQACGVLVIGQFGLGHPCGCDREEPQGLPPGMGHFERDEAASS